MANILLSDMNEKLNEIYENFCDTNSVKDAKIIIREFEPIKAEFDKESFEDYEEYFKITKMVSDYAIALVKVKQSDKAIHYLNRAISLIKQNEKLKNKNLFSEPLYESVIFHRGIANYDMRKFINSQLDLKKLIDNFPDNEKYRNWFNASRIYNQVRLEWILLALLGIFVALSFLLNEQHGIWNEISLIGILFFLTTSFILGRANKKLRKNVKYTP